MLAGNSQRIAIVLVPLQITELPVMERTVGRVAARGQGSGGKRLRKGRQPWREHGQERRDGYEFSPNPTQWRTTSSPQFKHKTGRLTTSWSNGQPRWSRACLTITNLRLTRGASVANIHDMPHSFLIFDFGTNEEAAQQARHRIEGWKQGFRLDKKLQLKFERKETEAAPVTAENAAAAAKATKSSKTAKQATPGKGKSKQEGKSKSGDESSRSAEGAAAGNGSEIRLVVRLDFSDHEKLSHQRWIERIPTEEPFKSANPKVIRPGASDFQPTSDLFDSLD